MRLLVETLAEDGRPQSSDSLAYVEVYPGGWNRPRGSDDYGDVVAVWRRQDLRSARLREEEAPDATDPG